MGTRSQEQPGLLTNYDTGSGYTLAYHTIFTNIRFNWDSEKYKQFAVFLATPAPFSGFEVAIANLAIAAAQNGSPTILVDADLHTNILHQVLGVGEGPGLSDLLIAETLNVPQVVSYLRKTSLPDLYLLEAGKALKEPQEMSRRLSAKLEHVLLGLRQALQETESRPALILFHSAAVLTGINASLIASQVDQTFLAIANGRTTRTQVRKAQEQLERAHAKLSGALILNV